MTDIDIRKIVTLREVIFSELGAAAALRPPRTGRSMRDASPGSQPAANIRQGEALMSARTVSDWEQPDPDADGICDAG